MVFSYLCIHDKDIDTSLTCHGVCCHSLAIDTECGGQQEQTAGKTVGFYGGVNVALCCPFHLLQ